MGKIILLLLVVVGAALAIPSTRAKIEDAAAPMMNSVRAKLVPRRLGAMADQLEARVARGQGIPASWEGWLRRDFSGPEVDPWGNPWFMEAGRRGITVGSLGPDGIRGTDDDITEERRQGR